MNLIYLSSGIPHSNNIMNTSIIKDKITKYDELLKEVDYHTNTYFKKILISLNEDRFQSYKNDLMKKYDKIGSMMAEQDKLQSEQYIQKKIERTSNNYSVFFCAVR